jgi:eight-cysteine-cluster-containing protein
MRHFLFTAALPLLSITVLAACAPEGEYDELAGETAEDEALDGKADGAPEGVYTYFQIRGDVRRCASPYCGGHFLQRLNRTTTVCHDRQAQAQCYTPELDWSESGLAPATQDLLTLAAGEAAMSDGVKAIVRGRFAPTGTAQIGGDLGRFIVTEAWVAQSDAVTDGVFVKLKDNGLRCIAAPCPSTHERALNTSRGADIADIDFSDSGLTDEQIGELGYQMFEPSGLIIAGDRFSFSIDGRAGKGRTATNAFVRLADAAAADCFVGGCSGQLCSDQEGLISTCEWREEYACYATASCERQADGACGWTPTTELNSCLANN